MLVKKLKTCLYFLIVAAVISCRTNSLDPGLKDMEELVGSWSGTAGDAKIFENWKRQNDYLVGDALVVEGNDTLVKESMKIEMVAGKPVFIARIEDGDPVLFTLIRHEDNKWIFENREHDFPQRVAYSLNGNDELNAYVEGRHQGELMKEEFKYTRVK